MTYHKYVVTAQKPTATQFAVKGPFTAPHVINLVLGKGTRIEIYTLTPDGLKPTLEFSIYGTITVMTLHTPPGQNKASLFILTARHKYCVLSYSEIHQQVVTEASGEVWMPGEMRSETNQIRATMDPTGVYVAATLYQNTLTIITPSECTRSKDGIHRRRSSLKTRESKKRHLQTKAASIHDYLHISLPDMFIVSVAFLQGTQESTLMVLYDTPLGHRFLELFTLDIRNRELVPCAMKKERFGNDATLLITMPAPVGGVVIISGQYIRFLHPEKVPRAIGIRPCVINSYSIMNESGSRIMLADTQGTLYLLALKIKENTVDHMSMISLGQIPLPSCLVYLDNDVVFVGSTLGDSQLVHIAPCEDSTMGDVKLEVIEEFPNLGPISDFCVADLDKQGQYQLITCSGVGKDSSLRIIRNGVGMNELAAIEVSGVKGIWALRPLFEDKHDNMLVISFFNQTRLLQLCDSTMIPVETYAGLALNQRTLITAVIAGDYIIQVTDHSVRLMESKADGCLLDEWIPQNNVQITVASVNPTQCVVSTGFGHLTAFVVQDQRLQEIGNTKVAHEISCIDISPTDALSPLSSCVVAVGIWHKVGVLLLSLPTLEVITEESLAGSVMPRSILMAKFEDICYLLVALGDGQFYNFKLDGRQGKLWDKKRTFLGKQPISLSSFTSNGTTHVFAASDKPSVIHSRNQKLLYSNVNLKEIRCVTSFNSISFPDAVALTTKDGLLIGQMEEIQKLHITKIAISDTPRSIIYQEATRTFGIVTEALSKQAPTGETLSGGFELMDDQSFTVLDRIYFQAQERPLAVTSTVFDNDANDYYILGTGYKNNAYDVIGQGRLMVFCVTETRKLNLMCQVHVQGIVEAIRPMDGKLLVTTRGHMNVYRWEIKLGGKGSLVQEYVHPMQTVTTSVAVCDNVIVAGDMSCSMTALKYNPRSNTIEELGSNEFHQEVTAVESLTHDMYIGAEREGHLFVAEHSPPDSSDPHEEPILEIVSQWHLGEIVHRLQFGSLGVNTVDPDLQTVNSSLIFAATSGAIGMIVDLSAERFNLLRQMQNNMNRIVKSVGGFSHVDWRNWSIKDHQELSCNVIDGDLIESFLDLTPQQMQGVVDGQNGGRKLDLTIEDLCKVVEELMSVHS
ncbi:mono-functional DNA-alkylating methyl methanesulfonate N-term-domain-containing protein [Spinellus fusiger]|nr:mono-functional DNA-alkylating methyl methanesulfonate N-term-domain-containing protein [Spinellus fusiger]